VKQESRYLTEAALNDFMASRARTAFRIPGVPEAQLVFLPEAGGEVALRVAWDRATAPDLSEYEHLSASVVRDPERAWAELLIDDPDVFRRTLPVVWRIADRIQLEDITFADAVITTLGDFQELLESASSLSSERELGPFGELTVVECLMLALGGAEAIAAWRGPAGDEHDFDLGVGDVEVKSTLSERRVHWIGSLSQLHPTPGRPLWMLSIQLTTGITGALTLGDLIERLRSRLTGAELASFDKKLHSAGWRDKFHVSTRRRFKTRSTPILLPVDAAFPALTQDGVRAAGVQLERLRQVVYSIDVAGLSEEPGPPSALRRLLSRGGT
jgi:hypothetical protein